MIVWKKDMMMTKTTLNRNTVDHAKTPFNNIAELRAAQSYHLDDRKRSKNSGYYTVARKPNLENGELANRKKHARWQKVRDGSVENALHKEHDKIIKNFFSPDTETVVGLPSWRETPENSFLATPENSFLATSENSFLATSENSFLANVGRRLPAGVRRFFEQFLSSNTPMILTFRFCQEKEITTEIIIQKLGLYELEMHEEATTQLMEAIEHSPRLKGRLMQLAIDGWKIKTSSSDCGGLVAATSIERKQIILSNEYKSESAISVLQALLLQASFACSREPLSANDDWPASNSYVAQYEARLADMRHNVIEILRELKDGNVVNRQHIKQIASTFPGMKKTSGLVKHGLDPELPPSKQEITKEKYPDYFDRREAIFNVRSRNSGCFDFAWVMPAKRRVHFVRGGDDIEGGELKPKPFFLWVRKSVTGSELHGHDLAIDDEIVKHSEIVNVNGEQRTPKEVFGDLSSLEPNEYNAEEEAGKMESDEMILKLVDDEDIEIDLKDGTYNFKNGEDESDEESCEVISLSSDSDSEEESDAKSDREGT
ncbi:MAG: hypothetical protein AAFN76_08605 [Pseudomonadota bacterium]